MILIHAAHHIFRISLLDDFSMIHEHKFLRIRQRSIQMMLGNDDCKAFLAIQLAHHFVEFMNALGIQRRGRFIEDQSLRLFRQHRSHH